MKIIIVVDGFNGGAGNMAQLLAIGLKKRGYDISIIMTNFADNVEPRHNLKDISLLRVQPPKPKGNRIKQLFSLFSNIKKMILANSPSIVISFITNNNIITCLDLYKESIPIISCERSNPIAIKPSFPWNILRVIAYHRSNVIVVQFDCFKNFLKGKLSTKCITIPNFVSEPHYKKNDYSIKDGSPIRIVAVGRLSHIKNYGVMFTIIDRLLKNGISCTLDVYGIGPLMEKLENDIDYLGYSEIIKLHGQVNTIEETLCNYDLYLITSIQEGFPNSLSEAMTVGLPCIAGRCHDGFVEIIENGVNGFLVDDVNDVNGYFEAIKLIATDEKLRESIGNNAKDLSTKYSESLVVGKWESIVTEIVNG